MSNRTIDTKTSAEPSRTEEPRQTRRVAVLALGITTLVIYCLAWSWFAGDPRSWPIWFRVWSAGAVLLTFLLMRLMEPVRAPLKGRTLWGFLATMAFGAVAGWFMLDFSQAMDRLMQPINDFLDLQR